MRYYFQFFFFFGFFMFPTYLCCNVFVDDPIYKTVNISFLWTVGTFSCCHGDTVACRIWTNALYLSWEQIWYRGNILNDNHHLKPCFFSLNIYTFWYVDKWIIRCVTNSYFLWTVVSLKIVFAPLVALELAILFDNIRCLYLLQ